MQRINKETGIYSMTHKPKNSGDKRSPSKSKSSGNSAESSSRHKHKYRRSGHQSKSSFPRLDDIDHLGITLTSPNALSAGFETDGKQDDPSSLNEWQTNFASENNSSAWTVEENGLDESTDGEQAVGVNKDKVKSEIDAIEKQANSGDIRQALNRNVDGISLDYGSPLYYAWSSNDNASPPISAKEISDIFIRVGDTFGFQKDNVKNMFEHLMVLLDSRSSRLGMSRALLSLHADYIGGENANFRKWYFAAQIDGYKHSQTTIDPNSKPETPLSKQKYDCNNLDAALEIWRKQMASMSTEHRISQIIIYLLCWGEANQVRFMPECLAFIFLCANEHYFHSINASSAASYEYSTGPSMVGSKEYSEFYFLEKIITPFYDILRGQLYENVNGVYIRKERDHSKVIGYDDINQLFWYKQGIERLKLENGESLVSLPIYEWYSNLEYVKWNRAFYKTYCETRSWLHMAINFNRIWIIHLSMFWFYTAFNSPSLYTIDFDYTKNNQPPSHVRWTVVALGAAIGPFVNIVATASEYMFVPRKFPGAQGLLLRLVILIIALAIVVAPTLYILLKRPLNGPDRVGTSIAIVQMALAIVFTIFFSITPLGHQFGSLFSRDKGRKNLGTKYFTAAFHELRGNDRLISYGLWVSILVAKLTESYFFLTLSLRDPIRELSVLNLSNCIGDVYLGPVLCKQQAKIVMFGMFVTDLVLFFLDSYLWYIIFNTLFSVARSFYLGVSIWTPWRNIYSRLVKRISSKILFGHGIPSNTDQGTKMVSDIWNGIIDSMYMQHLIPFGECEKLLFKIEKSPEGKEEVVEPTFFLSQEDQSFHSSVFEAQSEAERRISFFAQSLATPIPETYPIENMPTFTVLIPHYREKIMLGIREVIRGDDQDARISLLEYLKQLHPLEWDCFVEKTKEENLIKAIGLSNDNRKHQTGHSEIPFYCIGFKYAEDSEVYKTRIWASERAQTLYRTVAGFTKYSEAIRLLYDVENKSGVSSCLQNVEKVIDRKFRLLVSMQRYPEFNEDEREDTEQLLLNFPQLKIAYISKEIDESSGTEYYYSVLIDRDSMLNKDGSREPNIKIRLSGDPILGDGKGDNQNHAIIFYRGEYIQLVDANQDNYLEECLKIRSVLAEFEEIAYPRDPYSPATNIEGNSGNALPRAPVAILGAREYVFSENIGVLGDVAAGKEQTFGTLFARTLAKIGGKLHYGHPDFLNGIFMTTRGGVSKAQKGLHLNEDIYAGMTAILRGGRIKHSEYIQCGKGRDLGFGSILNFTSKIGAGMGEQMLSREYFYLGTRLPLDRFLSFYYAHPGFHINNMFIVVSLELFLVVMLNLAALAGETVICDYDPNAPNTDVHHPPGCQNLIPLFKWVERCVLSIFVVFFISFLPLFVQELTERGFWRSTTRLGKHLLSLSPIFEVFVCQIYAQSLTYDLSMGGAKYISTGRGFATSRISFATLYTRFATTSIYFGTRSFVMLLFIIITSWKVSLLWFLITTVALCLAPVIYNPHQFARHAFILDYRNFILWLFRVEKVGGEGSGQHINSWIGYIRENRAQITGYKRKTLETLDSHKEGSIPKILNIITSEVLIPLLVASSAVIPYLYVHSQNKIRALKPYSNPIMRLGICAFGPMLVDGMVILITFFIACCTNPLSKRVKKKDRAEIMSPGLAIITHLIAVVNHFAFFEVMWLMERWNFRRALLGIISVILVQTCIIKIITGLLLTRELKHSRSSVSWWTGGWATSELGWMVTTQPIREYICKVMEMSLFALDFTLGHFIFFVQSPLLSIPYIDRWHSMMLFWLRPKKQKLSEKLVSSTTTVWRQNRRMRRYSALFLLVMILFMAALIGPAFIPEEYKNAVADYVESYYPGIVSPTPAR
ncbi:1,3-beta-D-glucan synthase [Sugiyamaella lignohabitans]|uniref:1,3-beta-glucan synthase n=1 Tax=Sugiyamaella lignohabitans TaxID=796027 RepID=A0A167DF42_9ASCO|nr:1,3-beta-D-glucan synthase [Sugiyamaella lignohabitans]ANB12845.1 1,3-beta-D-glucan synthase [Sugiyamaella lignohabitans]